ncbi:MAG: S8 family peptidase [Candidatus Kariarchaeaceae archaeon]|jgi:subtilisin
MKKSHGILLITILSISLLPLMVEIAEAKTYAFDAKGGNGGGNGGGGRGGSGVDKSTLTVQYPWWNDVIDAEVAHTGGFTGKNTVVVILDTGLGSTWSGFFPAANILTDYSYSYTKALGKDRVNWDKDTQGHGTSTTATVIGYKLNDDYVEGVAPDAQIVMYRVLYWTGGFGKSRVTETELLNNWADAIYRALDLHNNQLSDKNMVISMSLGIGVTNSYLQQAIADAEGSGVPVSTSAGNDGPSLDTTGYPANYVEAVSVAAAGWSTLTGAYGIAGIYTDIAEEDFSNLVIADFSSRGKVDTTGIGWNLVLPSSDGKYYYISGTSFSCPQISGVFALMFEAYGDVTVSYLMSQIDASAVTMGTASTWGSGFVQADGAIGL